MEHTVVLLSEKDQLSKMVKNDEQGGILVHYLSSYEPETHQFPEFSYHTPFERKEGETGQVRCHV